MQHDLTFKTLKDKQRAIRGDFPENMGIRVHRSISWIGRAEDCNDDEDARFIFLWIAFNAAYANEQNPVGTAKGERKVFDGFFKRLVSLDEDSRIEKAIWEHFPGLICTLVENRFVWGPFWKHHNGMDRHTDWAEKLKDSIRRFMKEFEKRKTARVLSFVFDRLYVLRIQLMHGGATWDSSVNRSQVKDGAAILGFLIPVFVDLIMDHPEADWGRTFYPVID